MIKTEHIDNGDGGTCLYNLFFHLMLKTGCISPALQEYVRKKSCHDWKDRLPVLFLW
jgi:hypothetical protein